MAIPWGQHVRINGPDEVKFDWCWWRESSSSFQPQSLAMIGTILVVRPRARAVFHSDMSAPLRESGRKLTYALV
jgi:hypothetical protein